MKKTEVENLARKYSRELATYYDKLLLESIKSPFALFGKVVGYKKIKVPRYITIKIPMISRHYDEDLEYGRGEFEGFLISFEPLISFKIGTKTVSEPIYEKLKGKIKFKRYSKLKVKK